MAPTGAFPPNKSARLSARSCVTSQVHEAILWAIFSLAPVHFVHLGCCMQFSEFLTEEGILPYTHIRYITPKLLLHKQRPPFYLLLFCGWLWTVDCRVSRRVLVLAEDYARFSSTIRDLVSILSRAHPSGAQINLVL